MSAIIKSILIVIASIGLCNAANASNPVCRIIEAVPFVIDKGGCYYLKNDLFVSDISTNAITVLADDVTLDLAGQRIVGPDLPNVNGVGVYGLNIKNLHLKNGKISGFYMECVLMARTFPLEFIFEKYKHWEIIFEA